MSSQSKNLIIVSNRLPVSVKKLDGKLEISPSIGGLATGLAGYTKDPSNKWIGWPGINSDDLSEQDKLEITDKLKEYNCYPIFLSKKQNDDFYNGYCNRLLWPLFHDIAIKPDATKKEETYWRAYAAVNAAFAAKVTELSTDDDTVWVHDYQLLLLPNILRSMRPTSKIGFFLHIPFPRRESFKTLANGHQLITGLSGADLVGFHTSDYADNFLSCVEHYKLGEIDQQTITIGARSLQVLDFPMGIDYEKYVDARESSEVESYLESFQEKFAGQKVILTVDRLDPSKGLVERAKAYKSLLDQTPSLRGKVTMIMVVVPSRTEIKEYQDLKTTLELVIQSITTTHETSDWQPVIYRYEALPFHEVTALYRLADVAFIAPLRDGMNLVAKEYLASQHNQQGVLVLSTTAGAAQELQDAVMVNPHKEATVVSGLKQALAMPSKEFKRRAARMQRQIETSSVQTWAGNFMKSLNHKTPLQPSRIITRRLSAQARRRIVSSFQSSSRPLIILDYDGTLTPLVSNPKDAKPSKVLKAMLTKLAEKATVAIVSGRSQKDLDAWLGRQPVTLVAEHGLATRSQDRDDWELKNSEAPHYWQEVILPSLEKFAKKTPGATVEQKKSALVWHYRNATPYMANKNLVTLRRALRPFIKENKLEMTSGNKILEIRPKGINKGVIARELVRRHSSDFTLAIGDDTTDEDMFKRLAAKQHTTIKVGRGVSAAKYRVGTTEQVLSLLEELSRAD